MGSVLMIKNEVNGNHRDDQKHILLSNDISATRLAILANLSKMAIDLAIASSTIIWNIHPAIVPPLQSSERVANNTCSELAI
jgi:hypothetical protein